MIDLKPGTICVARPTIPRGSDPMGGGWYGAPRGARQHHGVDYMTEPGDVVLSPVSGEVTKIGLPYANEAYRYVQVTDKHGACHRVFYIAACVSVGDAVRVFQPIGVAQNITARKDYGIRGMKNHIHYEVMVGDGWVDPEKYDTVGAGE